MSKIITTNDINNEEPVVPNICGIKPCGTQVLVELLTQQELYNTRLSLGGKKRPVEEFQGYVKALGPTFKVSDWGFKVGDRVVISGTGVPTPNYDKTERDRVLMEPSCIKAVLVED